MTLTEQQRLHLFKTLEARLGLLRSDRRAEMSSMTNRFVGWVVGAMAVQIAVTGVLLSITL